MWLVGLFIIVVIAWLVNPVLIRSCKKADAISAASNAKQLYLLLAEFDQDYGQFPGDSTAKKHVPAGGGRSVDLTPFKGKYSNDYLAQLIAGGYVASEEIFVAPWEKDPSRKADNVISPRGEILKAGECGFSYVKNQSLSDNPGRPVLLATMSGNGEQFDPRVYGGKAVVLRIDGSVRQFRLSKKDNRAILTGGKTLFETGPDTVWGADGFRKSMLVHPEPGTGKGDMHYEPSIAARVIIFLMLLGIACMFVRRRK